RVIEVLACLSEYRFYKAIQLFLLFRALIPNQLSQRAKLIARGIAQMSQVGGVDLRVAAELPYIAVDKAGVQVGGETVSEIWLQPTTGIMIDVEMVLDRNRVTRY